MAIDIISLKDVGNGLYAPQYRLSGHCTCFSGFCNTWWSISLRSVLSGSVGSEHFGRFDAFALRSLSKENVYCERSMSVGYVEIFRQ